MIVVSSLIPEKWEEIDLELFQSPFDDLNDEKLEGTWYAAQIQKKFERTLREDGLINQIPFDSESMYANFFLRLSLYVAYGTRNIGLSCMESSESHIVIRPNGQFGFCHKSAKGDGYVCHKRGSMPLIQEHAEYKSGISCRNESEMIQNMYYDMINNPPRLTSRTIFDVIRWVWKETNINANFIVDGNWMQIDIIHDNVFDNDIKDLTKKIIKK